MTPATTTTRRRLFTEPFTEALQQQHCIITTLTTISRLFLVLLFEALALRIVALALTSRDTVLTDEALVLALALRVQALALALALRVQALAWTLKEIGRAHV